MGLRPNTTALVTGASGGIGLELARLLAERGFNLVLVARSAKKLERLAGELSARNSVDVRSIDFDLSDPDSPDALHNWLGNLGIKVDILVNNAGFAQFGPFVSSDPEAENQMMQLNVVTPTRLTKLLLPSMVERGSGKILNVSSTAAFQPGPLMAVYYATKAYLLSFSEALSEEVRGTGVTVTALCPGPTRSGFQERADMHDSRLARGRIGAVEQVAEAGIDGLMAGKMLVIPGWRNKLFVHAIRLSPRRVTPRVVRRLQERI